MPRADWLRSDGAPAIGCSAVSSARPRPRRWQGAPCWSQCSQSRCRPGGVASARGRGLRPVGGAGGGPGAGGARGSRVLCLSEAGAAEPPQRRGRAGTPGTPGTPPRPAPPGTPAAPPPAHGGSGSAAVPGHGWSVAPPPPDRNRPSDTQSRSRTGAMIGCRPRGAL
ncbi:cuticle collagen 2-like [Oenanthe melanoleuca]|uniref:cuticle collagen 2-like n=1 Tax=Oenanthe melanoleuca TaxID=2939378 RepID=UPI0024C1C930|nr:cuticle collagen 2-like [Oenanthe melanoleuca]